MLKAGSAGSNPDGAAIDLPASQPLYDFLQVFGEAVANLNSIVVGLDAVAQGHPKPDSMDISWDPRDRKLAAHKARRFAFEAVLVRCSEGLLQYALAMSRLGRYASVRSGWNGNTSGADKVRDIAHATVGIDDYLTPAALLLIHWRNRFVHGKSTAALKHNEKQLLRANEDVIFAKYKRLSVDCLLCHFQESRPTLKDVSTLIAMSITLARKIDAEAYSDLSKADLDAWLVHYELAPLIAKVEAESSPGKRSDSVLRTLRSLAPKLVESYLRHYILSDRE